MRIPIDPNGYSVSDDGSVHKRYADHGDGQRTRTTKGVLALLDGKRPKTCGDCYPHPQYPEPQRRRPPQRRRTVPRA